MADTDYTPTTEDVRKRYSGPFGGDMVAITTVDKLDSGAALDWRLARDVEAEAFDRWLAAHDREVAERAWDECMAALDAAFGTEAPWPLNPYRSGVEHE